MTLNEQRMVLFEGNGYRIESKGLKLEDFGMVSLLRNPNIANLMQRIGNKFISMNFHDC